jgi:hypothetical protein
MNVMQVWSASAGVVRINTSGNGVITSVHGRVVREEC